MHKLFFSFTFCFLLITGNKSFAQDLRFNLVLKNSSGSISDMEQDKQGVIWFSTYDKGLQRYDGVNIRSYTNDPRNLNSIAAGPIFSLFIDADNVIWMAFISSGVDRFDPATNTFTHFRHNSN